MYKKYLIIASKKDPAGVNITTQLSQFRKNPILSSISKDAPSFDFYLVEDEITQTENLDLEKINKYDFVIFASKHRSEKKERTLSVHAPGNWREAKYGGIPGDVCNSSAIFQKQIFEKLNKNCKEHNLDSYQITLEVTHHGPLIDKPCLFIEIGSTENEWKDRKAGFVIALTIRDIIEEFKENKYNEVVIGIGGNHYCSGFNKVQLKSNFAISHIIPQYVFPLTKEMVEEAIRKTEEEVDFFLVDWKGLGPAEQKQKALDFLKDFYLQIKRTSEVGK